MYALSEISRLTGQKPNSIHHYLLDHRIPYCKDDKGRVIVELNAMASYKPRSSQLWLAKLAASYAK